MEITSKTTAWQICEPDKGQNVMFVFRFIIDFIKD